MLAATITRVPVRHYLVRGLPLATASWWQMPALWILERICCILAHQVQCVSSSLRDDVVRRGLCSEDKCVVVLKGSSNGVDAETFFNPESATQGQRAALRARLGLAQSAVVVGFVGRLCRDKGIIELAAAWAEVTGLCPQAGLLVLGPMEASDAATKDAIDSLNASPRVRVIKSFLESREHYGAMDVLVLPSHREGFPNVCLEAAAMSLPVVTTDAVGCRDAVIDGVTGRIIPTGNWNLLARAIQDYVESPEMRTAHGVAGRNRVLRDYRPIDLWRAQSHLFGQLASPHRNRSRKQHPTGSSSVTH
jgi:glycosyltransferase involved in cell wall biosynthesis